MTIRNLSQISKQLQTQLRLFVVLTRPAVALLLVMFAIAGITGATTHPGRVVTFLVFAATIGYLVFSVAINDLADEAIDRINFAEAKHARHRKQRPLLDGLASKREMTVVSGAAGAGALGAAALLGWRPLLVTSVGLALSAAYSLRPVRIAERGAVAPMMLPACYVAVPFLLGGYAIRSYLPLHQLLILTGLYCGFIGRIVLKDFRDVRGDALFGKRTFLVRHGRRATCAVSAGAWTLGTAILLWAGPHPRMVVVFDAVSVSVSLLLLSKLACSNSRRHDDSLIATLAQLGRGTIALLVLTELTAGWSLTARTTLLAASAVIFGSQALRIFRHAPATSLTVEQMVGQLDPIEAEAAAPLANVT